MLADIGHRLETEAEATAWLRLKDEAMLEIIEHDPGAKCPKTLPGVPELLARLMDSRAVLGVASGITRVAANSKMDRAGLPKDAFSVWSLGDHVTRTDWLVQDAIDLVSASPGETLVVGNTPSYIEAAHACGARALAVATGPYSFSDLRRAGADYVAHSLDISDPAAIAVFGQ
jgi:phosphoglycolate phosphatase-like HAD superfamily hydrolase